MGGSIKKNHVDLDLTLIVSSIQNPLFPPKILCPKETYNFYKTFSCSLLISEYLPGAILKCPTLSKKCKKMWKESGKMPKV